MPLTPEQVKALKEQLKAQVQNIPEEQKQQALTQIESLSPEALESMLQQQQAQQPQQPQKDILRAIVDKDIPSQTIDENKAAIAVLDIKPISKGHTIIIPKKPAKESSEIPSSVFSLAKKISKKLVNKLKARGTEIQTEFKFGEVIINIIPIYDKPLSLNSPRHDAGKEELETLAKLLMPAKKKIPTIKMKKYSQKKILKLKRRIP